ncbi:MAG: biosynthetic-type acetolactate synthase large subunit [Candidatus Geothermarchaeales archaeon]
MVTMSGAQALIEALRREDVTEIFGLPGGAILPVYDLLLDSGIRHILARHEQSAAHMAEGYARASGRTGVCMATSGPGSTNLVTGIANAHLDSTPLVAFTGQVSRRAIGTDAFQETDIIGISTSVTKYNFQPRRASDIPRVVKKAFYIASSGRPGPVLIDLPIDVQRESDVMEFPDTIKIRGYRVNQELDSLKVKRAAELIAEAEKPVILAGGGIIISNASPELISLAEFLLAPVATTLMGKGCFPENHPLALGTIGLHGQAANKAVQETDALLVVGMRFSDRSTGWRLTEFCPEAKIIHVDIDPAEIGKNKRPNLDVVGDAKEALATINKLLNEMRVKGEDTPWTRRIKQFKEEFQSEREEGEDLKPEMVLKTLRELLPPSTIVTTEVGQNQMWAAMHFQSYEPRTFISSGGLGTMGFGFPAAIGAKVAKPDVPVVDIAGDGSFLMTENSLATSVTEDIPVIVVILNNRVHGMVAQFQRLFYNRRYSAVHLGDVPDFPKLAEAYGARGLRVGSIQEFSRAVETAMKSEVTTVIDVPIDPEENVLPMIPLGGSIREMIRDG